MNKCIDVEKIKSEIERRQEQLRTCCASTVFSRKQKRDMIVASEELDRLRTIITFLQQEQPESGNSEKPNDCQPEVDLEKEVKDYFMDSGYNLPYYECWTIARHFYELGLNARKSMWHNVAEEIPTENGSEVIVACRNKNKEDGIWLYDLIQCWEGKWEPRVNWETPVKWAYVRDLFNARKEE